MSSSFNILFAFLCNPCHWSCIFVIVVFLLLFLLFINDIDSLWFVFLSYVFLYCLSWNPWSANYSEVQTLKLPNPMFSSQALQFNNTISFSISPLKKKKNSYICNLSYFDIAQWRLWPLIHVHLVFKYKLLENCLETCFRGERFIFHVMFNAPNSVPVMHLLNHYFYNFWYEMKLSRNASFLNLHSMPHSHCQFRFCLLTQLSTSPGPERLVHVLKILTNTDKTFTHSTCSRISPLQSHILFQIMNAEQQMWFPTLLNLAGSWSPYQLLHVLLAVVVIQKFSGCKGGMSSERLIPHSCCSTWGPVKLSLQAWQWGLA